MGTLRAGSRGLRSVFGPSSQQLSWSRVPQRSVPAQGLLVQALGAPGPTAEACRAAVTPVCTTDALAVGTAGPASKTVSAAGIVVVAEAPFPTRHVAHTGQVGGREGRVLLLLMFGPSRCRCSQPGSSAGGPHSTRRGAAGSRPSPCSGSGSRSAPPGNWCAGHSPWCFRAGTRKPGRWASCSVRSPCPSSSYSVPCRHTCGPWGSSTGGPSSRQPLGQDSSPTLQA